MPLQESECSINVRISGEANQWSYIVVQWEEPCLEQKAKLRYGIRIEWLCRNRKLRVDGHRFSTAKVGAVTMRINLILMTLKGAAMCIINV
jgi:hypothetical protein